MLFLSTVTTNGNMLIKGHCGGRVPFIVAALWLGAVRLISRLLLLLLLLKVNFTSLRVRKVVSTA